MTRESSRNLKRLQSVVPTKLATALKRRAKKCKVSVSQYIRDLIVEDLGKGKEE